MGRKRKFLKKILVSVSPDESLAIDLFRDERETRSDFVRAAIRRELEFRHERNDLFDERSDPIESTPGKDSGVAFVDDGHG